MVFIRISGKPKPEHYPVTTSTAFEKGALTNWASGLLIPADATSGDHAGVIMKPIVSGDDDFATARKVMVDVPDTNDIFEVDVETGTLVVTDIGAQFDLVAQGDAIDVTATAKKVVTIVGFVSGTKALVKINAIITHVNVATT